MKDASGRLESVKKRGTPTVEVCLECRYLATDGRCQNCEYVAAHPYVRVLVIAERANEGGSS